MAESDEPISLGEDFEAIEIEGGEEQAEGSGAKITMFGAGQHKAQDVWDRQPNVTGEGAVHFKLFHAKLREDALEYLQDQVNKWLDAHPEVEVKFTNMTVGQLKTKIADEPALFMAVWV